MRTVADMRDLDRRLLRVEEFLRDKFGFDPNPAVDPNHEQRMADAVFMFGPAHGTDAIGFDNVRKTFPDLTEDELRDCQRAAREG